MIEDKTVACPKCDSNSLRKNGIRLSVHRGAQQQYQCKKCAHVFVIEGAPQNGSKKS